MSEPETAVDVQAASLVAAQLEQIAMARILQDRLALPALPQVATKCLTLLRRADFTTTKVTNLIESDPLLAMRVLRTSNSAAFGGRQPITNIQNAVTHLGVTKLKTVLTEAAARPIFESRNARITKATNGVWEHSIAVASLARDLATRLKGLDPENAYLAGLLHDVGKPVLATLLLEAEKIVSGRMTSNKSTWMASEVWVETLNRSHRKVGVAVTKCWGIPEEAILAITNCGEYDSEVPLSCANVVRLANAVTKQLGLYVGEVDADEIAALIAQGCQLLGIAPEDVEQLSTALKARLGATPG